MTYAKINELDLYYEEHGAGGEPLVLLHGGFHAGEMFGAILPQLSAGRRVITVDLQGHGHTADIDRPIRSELMADDIAALIEHLGLEQADLMGYSLGGKVALRTAIQHPERVRRLVVVSVPYSRAGNFPEVVATMDAMGPEAADMLKQSPLYDLYERIAPRTEDWPALVGKVTDSLKVDYDWSQEVAALEMPVMLAFADADSIRPDHVVDFYRLLGGGQRDANWDGSQRPTARLAVLPGLSHYDIFASPALPAAVAPFLDADL
jgi:pimeloyl-ACP methyl ester carboxylesterase